MLKRLLSKFAKIDGNSRAVYLNVIAAFGVKGLSLIVNLFATPAYIKYFNDDAALGIWYTFLSVITWILNFDLGIGNGLRNRLTSALAKGKKEDARGYISSAYISIGALVFAATAVSMLTFDKVNWNGVFNIGTEVISEEAMTTSVKIIFAGIMLQFFLRLISSVLYALQLSSLNNFLVLITSCINLAYVLVAGSGSNNENIIKMSVVHIIAVNLPLLTVSVIVFSKKMREYIPTLSCFRLSYARQVLGLGGVFFGVQIFYMILVNTNEFLISRFTDSANVVDYQIYHKLFTLAGTLVTLALAPVWSAVTKAFAERNFTWITKLYRRLLVIAGITWALEYVFLIFLQPAVNIWLGDSAIKVDYPIALIFASLGGLMALIGVLSSFANGVGFLKTQLICYGIGACVKVPLSYVLIDAIESWSGVILATVIILLIFAVAQIVSFEIFLKKAKAVNTEEAVYEHI